MSKEIRLKNDRKGKAALKNLLEPERQRKNEQEILESPGDLTKLKLKVAKMEKEIKTLQAQVEENRAFMLQMKQREYLSKMQKENDNAN